MRVLVNGRPSGVVLIALGAVLGLGLITIGIIRINNRVMVPQGSVAQPEMKLTRLVTAARPIERGQLIKPGDLKATLVFGPPPAQAIVASQDAMGRIATADIQPQQLILKSLIASDPAGAGLAMLVPVGQRVISIDTTDEIAVGGFLRPGDTVDIEIVLPSERFGSSTGVDRSEAHTLLQNIKVLTVGPTLSEVEPKSKDAAADKLAQQRRSLTLAMAPEQLGQFTLARQLGRYFLVLRNPKDEAVVPQGRTGLAALRGGETPRETIVVPQQSYVPSPRREAAPQARPVELIVGGERQIIYPGKGR